MRSHIDCAAGAPTAWLLGSRTDSAILAAELGLPFSYAHFFGISVEHGPIIVDMYRKKFRPSEYLSEPLVNVALQVLCADSQQQALRLQRAAGDAFAQLLVYHAFVKGVLVDDQQAVLGFGDQVRIVELQRSSRSILNDSPQLDLLLAGRR